MAEMSSSIGESASKTREALREVIPLVKKVFDKVKDKAKVAIDKTRKKYTNYIIHIVVIFIILLFFIYAWYLCIQDWINYGFDPTERMYKKALSTTTFAGVVTFITIIVMLVVYSLMK